MGVPREVYINTNVDNETQDSFNLDINHDIAAYHKLHHYFHVIKYRLRAVLIIMRN